MKKNLDVAAVKTGSDLSNLAMATVKTGMDLDNLAMAAVKTGMVHCFKPRFLLSQAFFKNLCPVFY